MRRQNVEEETWRRVDAFAAASTNTSTGARLSVLHTNTLHYYVVCTQRGKDGQTAARRRLPAGTGDGGARSHLPCLFCLSAPPARNASEASVSLAPVVTLQAETGGQDGPHSFFTP